MAYRYGEIATPCPPVRRGASESITDSNTKGSWSIDDGLHFDIDDDTAAVDFTTELRYPVLQGAKPKKAAKANTFKIHEDEADNFNSMATESSNPVPSRYPTKRMNKNSTILGQPAQRFSRPKVSFAAQPSPKSSNSRKSINSLQSAREKKPDSKEAPTRKKEKPPTHVDPLKKEKRRDTIYIPPDDTTVPTVFMGIFSPLKNQTLSDSTIPSPNGRGQDSLESRITKKRQPRQSWTTAPRRAPLQQSKTITQETATQNNVAGRNTGKENIPPGQEVPESTSTETQKEVFDSPLFDLDLKLARNRENNKTLSPVTKVESRGASPNVGKTPLNKKGQAEFLRKSPVPRPLSRKSNTDSAAQGYRSPKPKRKSLLEKSNNQQKISRPKRSIPNLHPKKNSPRQTPPKLMVPKIPTSTIDTKYPILTNDLCNTAMYEDDWLTHQEISLTQLVNNLFDNAHGTHGARDIQLLRQELLGIYQSAYFVSIYKRAQASLQFGALSISKEALSRATRLKDDIGVKREFLDLFVETYDSFALQAALEAVVGRKISSIADRKPNSQRSLGTSSSSSSPKDEPKRLRRALVEFIEIFILRNNDVDPRKASQDTEDTPGSPAWCYRRTVLRGIMIIVLLDKARTSTGTSLPQCLFVASSKYKSSTAVLQAFGRLLLPSIGDITRPLGHLDCQLQYVQHSLHEYEYRIHNIAVDLRDGILLARLAEILLYPPAPLLSQRHGSEATSTITMPGGETVSLERNEHVWPLSQHLKMPCVGRAVKLFNVQVTLSALSGVRGVDAIVKDIGAEDIVDGYREKTIALLWGLVGKWGLSGLADWDDVRREIRRLERKLDVQESSSKDTITTSTVVLDDDSKLSTYDDQDLEEENCEEGYEQCVFLLKNWASLIARLRGLHLQNLTTSFADGQIFQSIVEEYEGYIGNTRRNSMASLETTTGPSLNTRLQNLGCSASFGRFFLFALSPPSRLLLWYEKGTLTRDTNY